MSVKFIGVVSILFQIINLLLKILIKDYITNKK